MSDIDKLQDEYDVLEWQYENCLSKLVVSRWIIGLLVIVIIFLARGMI